jgi:chaperonin GroEL
MPAKKIVFDMEARESIKRGVQLLAKAVGLTLGPRGRNVVLQRSWGSPAVTKDGVTVAKDIELEDPYENMGAQMVREVAAKTSDLAGDGTTTATVLAEAILTEGLKNVAAGASSIELKRGIDLAVEAVVDKLCDLKIDVETRDQIAQVGTCAANQESAIGEIIADAMDRVGKDGVVTVEEGKSLNTEVDLVEGMQFDKGYCSAHFATDAETLECVLENPFVLIVEKKLSNVKEMVRLLEGVLQSGRALAIIAEDVDGELLATLVLNKLRGSFKCVAVKAPSFGERRKQMLGDIAAMTGAMVAFNDLGEKLESWTMDKLGSAKKIVVTKDTCTIIEGGGKSEDVKARMAQIKAQIAITTSDYDREKLEERLAKLSGGVAQINVGAATEVEMKEKKARVEDALHACRAAVQEGVLPGGGVAILRCMDVLDETYDDAAGDQKIGVDIVRRAIRAPIKLIAENAGKDGSVVCQRVLDSTEGNYGYNAQTDVFGDMVKMGVIVPLKVERVALQNAASVAGLILTADAVVADIPKKPEHQQPMGMDM